MVCPVQLDAPLVEGTPEAEHLPTTDMLDNLETWYNDGFLIGLCQAALISEQQHNHCFNCQKEGHHWCECKETLSPELQELADKQDRE